MKTRCIKLAEIVTTAGTQIRARIDSETVDQYAEAMLDAGNKFPPVVVFHDGSQFILADGFHRVMAASRNGFLDIEADVQKGTKSDALKYALGANSAHGLKRSNADKGRSVELALGEWPKLSDREIARICAVSDHFVGHVRKANCEPIAVEQTRIGADGKKRRMPRKPEPAPDPSPAPPVEPETAPTPEPSTAPPTEAPVPHTLDRAWTSAIGISDARNFFAGQIEDVISGAIEQASEDQLHAVKLALESGVRKIRAAINQKRQEPA